MGGMLPFGLGCIVRCFGVTRVCCSFVCLAWWMMQAFLFVLLLCCGLLFENYIVDASIFWNLR